MSAAAATGEAITLASILDEATARLAAAGEPAPRREVRRLAEAVLGLGASAQLAGDAHGLSGAARDQLLAATARRAAGEPLARITGQTFFWDLALEVSPATLEPRSDSETLVEVALSYLQPAEATWRVADLGTGTGCLLLALLQARPAAWGVGLDVVPAALATAKRNARHNRLAERAAFAVSDWTAALGGRVDLVVANPPYVAADEWAGLAPAVADHDPLVALDGGADGLSYYRRLLPALRDILTPAGVAVLETSPYLAAPVADLATAEGHAVDGIQRDLSGNARCLAIRPSGSRPGKTSQDETMRA